ncbi:glutathione-dependent formaldehyde dehydrogenase [Microtetraspora sp. NBRC 13810]|uniref:zinc-dependent alcohol dehydrogenase n=1 Tax=Microtetraspora sp. NBRC 13810 TaxID=3030990 RepID=UPI0024A04546|nr:zinc-dependent alcohol dehydrogenase [Microtetraspora sp. NBRC 13810]GLW10008.1 glutathione-dependent formaldehyde dehydrogenase [Microtetraspora sp. NBRC 13810]
MKANCWMGRGRVEVRDVPDPVILSGRDAVVRITSTAICGTDLHLYDGRIPTMEPGDILGHEFMGEVVEVGPEVSRLRPGDRVVVPFPIACGGCSACEHGLYSVCENSNPNAGLAEKHLGHSPAGVFGFSHMFGGFAGGQAEYARVPFADVGPIKIEDDLPDEKVLFLSDILPTGWMGAEMCDIKPGDTVAVWGAGPVGLFTIMSAYLMGAERVVCVDRLPYRLRMAERAGALPLDYEQVDVIEALRDITAGRGPDACVDAVGMEAHHPATAVTAYDRARRAAGAPAEQPYALREAIMACRNGGVVSVVGAYGGMLDGFPMGSLMNRSLTLRAGQCHVQRYLAPLLARIRSGEIDPSVVITHRMRLQDAPRAYEMFRDKQDECHKVLLTP